MKFGMYTKILIISLLYLVSACGEPYPDMHIVPDDMTVTQKKQRFRDLILPAVLKVNTELNTQYQQVLLQLQMYPNQAESIFEKYKVANTSFMPCTYITPGFNLAYRNRIRLITSAWVIM